jgi:hypothetical protein
VFCVCVLSLLFWVLLYFEGLKCVILANGFANICYDYEKGFYSVFYYEVYRLRPIFYLYLSVFNSVSIAIDLATEIFQNLTVKIMVSNSVSKETEILVTNYWSLIRSL